MNELIKQNLLRFKENDEYFCTKCQFGKRFRGQFKSSKSKAESVLDLVHFDVCGPLSTESIGGSKYFITFLNFNSHYAFIYFMRGKDEVADKLIKFINFVTNQSGKNLKVLRSDGAKENTTRSINSFLESKGIKHEISCPYTPEQNDKAERLNRTLEEIARSMLIEANLDQEF